MTTPTKEDVERAERFQICSYCGGTGLLAEQVDEEEVNLIQCDYCYSTGDAYSDRTKETIAVLLADERERTLTDCSCQKCLEKLQ